MHPASASFSIKKLNRNEEVRNEKVIVSLFELTSGFQINQTFQEVVLLSDFLQSQRYTITTKRNLEILNYPTEQPNQADSYIFTRLRQLMQQQYDSGDNNYRAILVEYRHNCGVFVFDGQGFVDYKEATARLRRRIQGRNGITLTVQRNPRAKYAPQLDLSRNSRFRPNSTYTAQGASSLVNPQPRQNVGGVLPVESISQLGG